MIVFVYKYSCENVIKNSSGLKTKIGSNIIVESASPVVLDFRVRFTTLESKRTLEPKPHSGALHF